MNEDNDNTPKCCDGCAMWKTQGNKCWYYWEGKKECTQHNREGNNQQDFSHIKK